MKTVLVGLWVALVALGTAYGVSLYLPGGPGQAKAAAAAVVLQSQKTRVINVPVVADGVLQGFVSAQFVFTIDSAGLKTLQVPPEAYLLDEAFRAIYADGSLDRKHVEKFDLKKLTAELVERTNAHLGAPLVKDVLIENFSYIDKDENRT